MAKEYSRASRVGEEIRRLLAEFLLRGQVADPRIGMVTITAVEVSRDFAHAKVHVSVLELAAGGEESVEALNHAAGFLRSELGRKIKLRTVPQLHFVQDNTERDAVRMDQLIKDVRAVDKAAATRRGDADES